MTILRLCSYNIHKGFSQLNRRMAIHDARTRLREMNPDICFLQEVQGLHLKHERRHVDWPVLPQHQFLAGADWHAAYGANAAYEHGHHGNAILSRFEIQRSRNQDVSQSRLERRGVLHCELSIPGKNLLHCLCVHLSLTERQRLRQIDLLVDYVEQHVPRQSPLIIAGDFNDWRSRVNDKLSARLGMLEAFTLLHGEPARSYPSHLPVLRLDRVFLRGLEPLTAQVHSGKPWSGMSDHALLEVRVRVP